ncbi:MAG: ABC transporter permease [Tepidanaerobacteraceae bacterium]|jgi:ribose/xylose/arabinose/galactoside ABC-type transport system permease subunit
MTVKLNEKKLLKVRKVWDKLGVWLIVIILFFVLAMTCDNFLTDSNLINVIRQICVNAIVALGTTYVILSGEIDLSQGAMAALIGCECAVLIMHAGINVYLAILISLLSGVAIGVVIGLIVTYLYVPAFIATLGMQYILQGCVLLLTNSQPIPGLPDSFLVLGRGYVGQIPVPTIILFCVFLIGAFGLKYTSFGRDVLATGENQVTAKLSGIEVKKTKIMVFAIAGAMSALGGIILTARLSSGQPSSASDLSLQALAAVFIGGTGDGSVISTLAGALIIGLINNGLNLLEVNAYWQKIALGVIIVGAIALDAFRSSQSASK